VKELLEIYGNKQHLYQWDINQKVIVDDKEVIQVHFDNGTGTVFVCELYEYNGVMVADVPNILLTTYLAIKAYAVCEECVRHERVIQVERRTKPSDYVYTETEVFKYENLESRIDEIEKNGISQDAINTAVSLYMDENPIDINGLITTDETLTLSAEGQLKVNTTNDMEQDNTLPITSAGVYVTVGNIEALLKTI